MGGGIPLEKWVKDPERYKMKTVMKWLLGIFTMLIGLVARAEGEIAAMQTAATGYITDAVTAVAALALAGLAIAGILWGVRKIKAGIRSA